MERFTGRFEFLRRLGLSSAIIAVCVACTSCFPQYQSPEMESEARRQMEAYDAQAQRVDDQLDVSESQSQRYTNLLNQQEENNRRMSAILDRWEAQADRLDRILDAWERSGE